MDRDVRIVGLCGSLRGESETRVVLREVLGSARTAGATTEPVDLQEYNLPAYDPDRPDPDDTDDLRRGVE